MTTAKSGLSPRRWIGLVALSLMQIISSRLGTAQDIEWDLNHDSKDIAGMLLRTLRTSTERVHCNFIQLIDHEFWLPFMLNWIFSSQDVGLFLLWLYSNSFLFYHELRHHNCFNVASFIYCTCWPRKNDIGNVKAAQDTLFTTFYGGNLSRV